MKDLTHYIIIIGMCFYCYYRWVYKKCTPKSAAWHRLWFFEYSKNRNTCESSIHQEPSKKLHQNQTRNKEVKATLAKFSETFASRAPNFILSSTFYSDSESSWWEKWNGFCPIEIGRLVLEIWGGPNRPPQQLRTVYCVYNLQLNTWSSFDSSDVISI